MLAYSHMLRIDLPGPSIAGRMTEVRAACENARFGACNVLRIDQSEHGGSLTVRIAPGGVEPLSRLAAQGGRIGFRQTTAEDLSSAVQDNRQQLALLESHAHTLEELAAGKDLSISDRIALSHEQASVQQQLQALHATEATQQRQLDTNRLELDFRDRDIETGHGRIAEAAGDMLDQAAEGVADVLRMLGYGLPFLILAFPLALLWRWLWRRMSRRGNRG
ncbi:DUF4349 domain-containing protein [Dyella ginsengisoli]|uniref:DUF4349 domain-containing protein n=2 Tax=Dyella ginsengisoli TaxID=363848 RepID=A0ABW8JRL7_9GAMM